VRKTLTFTVSAEGRDKGKVFLLTEMAASRAEKWAIRALLALGKAGVEVGDALSGGMQDIARLGYDVLNHANYEDIAPLLDEMMDCVQVVPNPGNQDVVRRLIEDDICEVLTRLRLRMEVFKLHLDFSMAAAPSTSASGPAATSA
jgi:hypothetical protein